MCPKCECENLNGDLRSFEFHESVNIDVIKGNEESPVQHVNIHFNTEQTASSIGEKAALWSKGLCVDSNLYNFTETPLKFIHITPILEGAEGNEVPEKDKIRLNGDLVDDISLTNVLIVGVATHVKIITSI